MPGKRSLQTLLGGAPGADGDGGGGGESEGTEDYWSEEEELLKIDPQYVLVLVLVHAHQVLCL